MKLDKMKYFWTIVYALSIRDFKSRDQGSILGFIWTLMHPLIYFLVLYNLFVKWMGTKIPSFPLYLIIGIVQWGFFASATSCAIGTIPRYGAYIKSINLPKSALVIATVISVLITHLLELVTLIAFWGIVGAAINMKMILILPLLLLNIYLVLSMAYILATIGVYFLDINRIWGIFMSVGFFLTPIFYSMDMLSPQRRKIILLNPMTHIIQASRDVMIANKMPDMQGLLYVLGLSTVMMIAGYRLFKAHEGYFVERL